MAVIRVHLADAVAEAVAESLTVLELVAVQPLAVAMRLDRVQKKNVENANVRKSSVKR